MCPRALFVESDLSISMRVRDWSEPVRHRKTNNSGKKGKRKAPGTPLLIHRHVFHSPRGTETILKNEMVPDATWEKVKTIGRQEGGV